MTSAGTGEVITVTTHWVDATIRGRFASSILDTASAKANMFIYRSLRGAIESATDYTWVSVDMYKWAGVVRDEWSAGNVYEIEYGANFAVELQAFDAAHAERQVRTFCRNIGAEVEFLYAHG